MPFIGTQPEVGGYSVLDALTASATASYTLQLNSVNFSPSSANQLLVSLNGVIQKPGTSFTVSGSTLTFSSALTSSDSIDFIIAMGEPLLVGVPSDATVTGSKLASNIGISTTGNIATTGSGTLSVAGSTTLSGTAAITGLITASAGVAIGGTGAANTLDDYEEGTFTPVSNSGTLSSASGVYTKIGNVVRVGMKFTMPSSSSGSSAEISGLPFTCFNDNAARAGIVVSWNSNGQGNAGLDFLVQENGTKGTFYIDGSSRTYANLSSDTIYMGGTYPVA